MSTALTGSDPGQGEGSPQGAGNPSGTSGGDGGGATGTPGAGTPPAQTTEKTWRDELPEDIRGNGAIAQFKDIASLAKSYVHAQSLIGKKGVVVPGEKATPEEWASFYKAIGQPEADKFEVSGPKDVKLNETFLKGFKEVAHKSGLLPKQAQGLLEWYLETEKTFAGEAQATVKAEQERGLDELKKEWGQGYTKQIALAKAAVKELGDQDLIAYLDQSGLGNDPKLIRLMAKAGALLGEDHIRGEGGGQFGKTPAEIRKEINDVMGNKEHPYFDAAHPGHKQAVADMSARYKALTK